METQILACLIDISFIGTQHILYKQLLGKKYKNKLLLTAGWGICFALWNAGGDLFTDHKLFFAIYACSVNFAALCALYRGHVKAKAVLMECVVLLKAAAEGITALFFVFQGMPAGAEYSWQIGQPDIRNVISHLFFFLFVEIILSISVKQIQTKMKSIDWLFLFLVPIESIVICYAVWRNTGRYAGLPQGATAAVLMLMNLQAYYMCQRLQVYMVKDMGNELLRQQNEAFRLQYEKVEKQWKRLCILRHNMANHYALEMGYLEKGQYNMLMEYCGEKLGEIKKTAPIVNTGNIGIDSILNYKLEAAGRHRIKVEDEIEIEKEVIINDIDLNILIGNLFDNALEAVKGLDADKRKLYIAISADRSTFLFQIRNPYEGRRVKDCRGNFLTRKKDKAFHGLGLKEVRRVVKKYHGKMTVSAEGGEFNIKVFIYM